MSTVLDRNAAKVKEMISAEAADEIANLERAAEYRLSDAIREGSKVSNQAYNWTGENDSMCALSAAVTAAKARGYIS